MTPRTVIEASWEVVNKVGGINTVVRTKARLLCEHYDEYMLVGPLFPERRDIEFSEQAPPDTIREVFKSLRDEGIHCVYGTWNIPGSPRTVLVDARSASFSTDRIKTLLWERYGVDTLFSAWDFEEPLRWAWAVGMLIQRLQERSDHPLVAQFHEWLAGLGLLYLDIHDVPTATVFTTHATMLGRTISGTSEDLSSLISTEDPLAKAKELRVIDKHTTEVACARAADIFTTVSDITALEAEHLLGRAPDIILYNGVPEDQYPDPEHARILHDQARDQLREFVDYYFFSHYDFDIEQSLMFFSSGRYEYRNKGFDVFIEALARLNDHLREVDHRKTVIAFFFVPGETHGIKTEVLEERSAYRKLQQEVSNRSEDIVRRIVRHADDLPAMTADRLFDEQLRTRIAELAASMQHPGNPSLCTHNIPSEDHDPIVSTLRTVGLENGPEDKVKAVRIPVYLDGRDGLLDLPYDQVVAATHLGVFPSAYEPWGYTPVETAALGVPAITTDLAGFGRYIAETVGQTGEGVWVVPRHERSREDAVEELVRIMKGFCDLDQAGRRAHREAAKQLAAHAGWETFIKSYYQAHQHAYAKHATGTARSGTDRRA